MVAEANVNAQDIEARAERTSAPRNAGRVEHRLDVARLLLGLPHRGAGKDALVTDDARRPRDEDGAAPRRRRDRPASERRAPRAVALGIAERGDLARVLEVASGLARR